MKYFPLFALFLLFLLASCKKEETAKLDLLTSNDWITDFGTQMVDPCREDDKTKFSPIGILTITIDEVPCADDLFTTIPGTWQFDQGETYLLETLLGRTDTFEIKTLSETALELIKTDGQRIKLKHK